MSSIFDKLDSIVQRNQEIEEAMGRPRSGRQF